MAQLKEQYNKQVLPELMKKFHYKNIWQAPKLHKAVVNVGISASNKDPKFLETVEQNLQRITGQKPLKTLAKKSISNFKIREGQVVGMKVTLRGKRMYDFIDKVINIALPRIRDFRGIPLSTVDKHGNLNLGFREHISFPEIKSDEVEKVHGLEITVTSSAKTEKEGYELFHLLGFPFHK